MLVLGLSGGTRPVEDPSGPSAGLFAHDGAAVLLDGGVVVAACEQERCDRIRHSDKAPLDALRRCLQLAGARLDDVEHIAFGSSEAGLQRALAAAAGARGKPDARAVLSRSLGVPEDRLLFVKHHLAHAASAFGHSGWDEALVCTFDGAGEDESGLVAVCLGSTLSVKSTLPLEASLGRFYGDVSAFLGCGPSHEDEVMGLAPRGDAGRYRDLFGRFYELEAEGKYRLHQERLLPELGELGPRSRGEPFHKVHEDVAAALQETLLLLELHVLEHARRLHGMRRLCLAGGVAQNSAVNGDIVRSGIFEEVFVQPAAHDAGLALGAALAVHLATSKVRSPRVPHVFWGTDVAAPERELARWGAFVTSEEQNDIVGHAARRLAAGDVIGWVQGRAEFGPRALGNRVLLADPRPLENRALVDEMVRRRLPDQPFAPVVPLEDAATYFEVEPGAELSFATFSVDVRREHRELLGAVTHVDGTARVQTVSQAQNERLWSLLRAFGERTGVPVLLQEPLRNHAEPVVDSVADALVCFLTTELDALVVGDFWVTRRRDPPFGSLAPQLARHVRLERITTKQHGAEPRTQSRLVPNQAPEAAIGISAGASDVLLHADGRVALDYLTQSVAVHDELHALWCDRLVVLAPALG